MQQYFSKNKNLELDDGDYYHIKNVMRMKIGDNIKIVYDNVTYLCEITSLIPSVCYKIISENKSTIDNLTVDVAFSLIKEQRLDYLLQKSTELGVSNLLPVITERSVVKIDGKKMQGKIDRWSKILKEASEQSFRSNVPGICEVKSLKDIGELNYDLKLLCSLNENTINIKKALQKNNKCDKILLVVGPEGGFTKSEEEYLINKGFISVSLGSTVLRAETAPVVALSMINYELRGE